MRRWPRWLPWYIVVSLVAGLLLLVIAAVTAIASTPPQHIRPGDVFFKGGICQQVNEHTYCLTTVQVRGRLRRLATTEDIRDAAKVYWHVIFVGHVTSTKLGAARNWPFRNPIMDSSYAGDDVLNFEWAPRGYPRSECINNLPGAPNNLTYVGTCSPARQGNKDNWYSYMLWKPGTAILEVHSTNASRQGTATYVVTSVQPQSDEVFTFLYGNDSEQQQHWYARMMRP